jgi:hypothetical protein
MSRRKSSQHDVGLTQLLLKLRSEISNAQIVSKETQFMRGNQIIAEPDGLIWDGETIHIIEYKCNEYNENKAQEQLNRAQRFIENDLGFYVPCKKIFGYG